uniref:Uncharacterized protein n=1 Tax=Setaria digitata TaxID=48799 RepID=A0A915Q0Y5_9BILA
MMTKLEGENEDSNIRVGGGEKEYGICKIADTDKDQSNDDDSGSDDSDGDSIDNHWRYC